MRTLVLIALLALCAATEVRAQEAPHDFTQDTPPPPGQIVKQPVPGQTVEQPREELRYYRSNDELALPSTGPQGSAPGKRDKRQVAPDGR